ncbi:transient receptor potential cation channel trpm-like [Ptychodera flava]|uniref:transient receptor potential cation channel trpm-like n=1 Tax=Ptychodera flava TaxID=63121 RepID=UPI00396A8311
MYIIFLGFYLFVGHLLMMNLLIAIFNRDIEKVNEKSKEIWTYEHYILHEQFSEKPVLPEPFSLLAYFYYLVRFIIRKCCSNDEQSDGNTMACTEFVQKCMSQYKEEEKQSPDHSHEQMISQLKQICDDIRKRKLTVNTVYINATKIKHNTNAIDEDISGEDSLGKRMEAFEKRVMEKLDELVGAKDKK